MIDWKVGDQQLVKIAKQRAGLDAEESRWLRLAEEVQIWKELGMVSALDYMERKLGYAPHAANERLRVARELGRLPMIESALGGGGLAYSAVRELTRVATPETEAEWVEAAHGKNLRQIEGMVSGRKRGARPGDPADPEIVTERVVLELSPEVYARLRDVRAQLSDEHGKRLDDDGLIRAMCEAVLGEASTAEPSGRAKFQIAITKCESCERAWQEGGGKSVAIDAAALELASCDAQHIGSVYGDAPERERAAQNIPPAVKRFVWRRDRGRCQVPGCRSARALDLHHIRHREHGGDHNPSSIALLCGSCHAAHHRGALHISGTAAQLVVTRPHEVKPAPRPSHGGPSAAAGVVETTRALVQLGFSPKTARLAVEAACNNVSADAPIEVWLRAALAECPRPTIS